MNKTVLRRDFNEELEIRSIEDNIVSYLNQSDFQPFVSYSQYVIAGFDWYRIGVEKEKTDKLILYMTKENLFLVCDNDEAYQRVESIEKKILDAVGGNEACDRLSNEEYLFYFFLKVIQSDRRALEEYESELVAVADMVIAGVESNPLQVIVSYRRELMEVGRYLEGLTSLFDEFYANDNGMLSEDGIRLFDILRSRVDRCQQFILVLREHVEQMRESYQAQIDIRQNDLVRVFTVVTSIFMPLTILVGWYGMNLNMPEFSWKYGYAFVIALGILVSVVPLAIFRKKKWI